MKTKAFTTFGTGVISLAVVFFLAMQLSTVQAQTGKMNFTGTWAFNESKSTAAEGGFRFAPSMMVVTQDGNNLTVERTSVRPGGEDFKSTDKFTLDGKECVNPMFNSSRKSMVKWSEDGKVLAFSHTMTFERDGNSQEFKTSEIWKYNETDKTLTVETSFAGPDGEMKTANVYDKK
jgi:hypothetical protein